MRLRPTSLFTTYIHLDMMTLLGYTRQVDTEHLALQQYSNSTFSKIFPWSPVLTTPGSPLSHVALYSAYGR